MSGKGKCGVPGCSGPNDVLGVCASCHRRYRDGDKSIEPYIRTAEPRISSPPTTQSHKGRDLARGRMIAKVMLPARRGRRKLSVAAGDMLDLGGGLRGRAIPSARAQEKAVAGIALSDTKNRKLCPVLLPLPVKEAAPINRSFGETVDYLIELLRPLDQHRRICVVSAAAAFLRIDMRLGVPNA